MTDSQHPQPSPEDVDETVEPEDIGYTSTDDPDQQIQSGEIEGLVAPGDIRSTSRSCLVIILTALFIVLMLCVFVVVQTWVR